VAQDENLRRITVSNDNGDVYVESSGDGSEIVLKTEKVRVTDGDVYCGTSNVGLSARIDALKIKDDAIDEKIDTLNATGTQLKATDETLKTRIASLNATDAELKGVDDGLSSRIDALRDIYANELNVTDKQLIVTDAKLGSRIDSLNATQYELKGVDTGLSSRIQALESTHVEYERIDAEFKSNDLTLAVRIDTVNTTCKEVNKRLNVLNATDDALQLMDAALSTQIQYLTPPKCNAPGGDKLEYNGTHWICKCVSLFWRGVSCEIHPPWMWKQRIGPIVEESWAFFESDMLTIVHSSEMSRFDLLDNATVLFPDTGPMEFFVPYPTITPSNADWGSDLLQGEYLALGSPHATLDDLRVGVARVYKRGSNSEWESKFSLSSLYDSNIGRTIQYGSGQAIGVIGTVRTFFVLKKVSYTCKNDGRCASLTPEIEIYVNSDQSSTWSKVQGIVLADAWLSYQAYVAAPWPGPYGYGKWGWIRDNRDVKTNDFQTARDGQYFFAVYVWDMSGSGKIVLYKNPTPATQGTWSEVASWYFYAESGYTLELPYSFSGDDTLVVGVSRGYKSEVEYVNGRGYTVSVCAHVKTFNLTNYREIQSIALPHCVDSVSLHANEDHLVVGAAAESVVYVYSRTEHNRSIFTQVDQLTDEQYDNVWQSKPSNYGAKVALNNRDDVFVMSGTEVLVNSTRGVVHKFERRVTPN